MIKAELKSGMVVTLRNGNTRVVAINTPFGDGITNLSGKNVWKRLDAYTDDLKDVDGDSEYDIMSVAVPVNKFKVFNNLDDATNLTTVWTRPAEARRITMDELRSMLGFDVIITA